MDIPIPVVHELSPKKKSKKVNASHELRAVQEEYTRVVGKLPGGQWGSNLEHLKKKIAKAQAINLDTTDDDAPLPSTKRIDAIQAQLDNPATPARYISDLIKQRDLLSANRKIEKKKNRAAGVVNHLKTVAKKAKVELKEVETDYAPFRKQALDRDDMGYAMKNALQPFAKDEDFFKHAQRCLDTIIAYRKASIASVVTKNRYEQEKQQAEELDAVYKQRLAEADAIAADIKEKQEAAELNERVPGRPRMTRRMSDASDISLTFEDEAFGSAEEAAEQLRQLYEQEQDTAEEDDTLRLDSDEENAYGQLPRA